MTAKQIIRFIENGDSASIQFRPFNLAPKDKYPTFTICLTGSDLYWNKAKLIFRKFGIHPSKFVEMLKGKDVFSYDYNYTSMLYNKIPVDISHYQNVDVKRFSLNITEILTGLEFGTQCEDKSISHGSGEKGYMIEKIPFEEGYTTSDTICFTRTADESLEMLRTYDWVAFDKSVFASEKYQDTILQIFVHYPQQLMRKFHMPVFKSPLSKTSDSWNKLLKITIGKVTILRKRSGSNVPCDENLVDDDDRFQEELINYINCTPIYWGHGETDHSTQTKCQSKSDLEIADLVIQQYKHVLERYHPPCNQMEISSRYDDWTEKNDLNDARLMFSYEDNVYEEIQNSKSFDLESFVSGVGGFIGIFLGYSILQIPELLEVLASLMYNVKQGKRQGKIEAT